MKKYYHWGTICITIIAVVLSLISCGEDDSTEESSSKMPSLSGTKWQSQYTYDTPIIDPDYVSVSKFLITLYFLDDHRYISKVKSKEVDSNLGYLSRDGENGGTYSVSGSKIILTPADEPVQRTTYLYKNGKLVMENWEQCVLEKQGSMTASEKEWAENEFYGFLPDKERYDFTYSIGSSACIKPQYSPADKSYITSPIVSFSINAKYKLYEKKLSHVEATFSLQNATFDNHTKRTEKISAAFEAGKDLKIILNKGIYLKGSATLTATYKIYDAKRKKYIYTIEHKYAIDTTNGLTGEI